MDRTVTDYHGEKIRIVCGEDEIQSTLQKKLIDPFSEEIETAWLSGTKAEERTKNYLSYVASLMLREPDRHNVLSAEKIRSIQSIEIPVSQISGGNMENQTPMDMQGQKTKNKIQRKETRFDRLMKIHREFPDGIFTACAVDTENKFIYREKAYEIDKSVEAYLPETTKDGELYYAMDSILVLDDGKILRYYDQDARPIDTEMITAK